MEFKKTYTMVPKCSLGLFSSSGCGHPCSQCDASTQSEVIVTQVPHNQPVIVSAHLNKEQFYSGEVIVATVEFDRPVDRNKILIECSYGIITTSINNEYGDDMRFTILLNVGQDALGKKNICIGYKGVNRYFHISVIKPLPKIMEVELSPMSVSHGENVVVTIKINRELERDEPFPQLVIDNSAFDLIEDLKPLAITKAAIRGVVQAKGEPGVYRVLAQYPGQPQVVSSITIEKPDEIEWATKEDIDALFPELNDDGGVIVPDPDLPPLVVEWATEEDIDALFPELQGK